MDRDLPLVPTIIFIASLIIAIALYMQASPKLHRPPVSQFILNDANGLQVLFKNRLVSLENDSLDRVLSEYGISQHVGRILLLDGGDLVLNAAGQNTSLLHKWRSFKRKTELKAKGGTSLLHCDSQFLECNAWGDDALHFDTPWSGLSITNDRHVILDTSRHQVYLLNENGDLLDTLKGFKFPNHATLIGGDIWVVDTNHNTLVPLKIEDSRLIRSHEALYLNDFIGINYEHLYPSMAYKVDDAWFVLIHANGMDRGRVYRLEDGKATQLFQRQKDISSLYFSGGKLFVATYSDHSLWSMSLDSGDVQRIQSNSFENSILAVDKEIRSHRIKFYLQAGAVIAIGFLALIFSLRKSTPSVVNAGKILVPLDEKSHQPSERLTEILWVSKNQALLKLHFKALKKLRLLGLGTLTITSLAAGILLATSADDKYWPIIALIFSLSTVFISMPWVVKQLSGSFLNSSLGSNGKDILVKDIDSGDMQKVNINNTLFSNQDLYDGKVYITWQDFGKVYFDKLEFEELISPLLQKARKVSLFRIYLWRLRCGERGALAGLVSILFSVAAMVVLHRFT